MLGRAEFIDLLVAESDENYRTLRTVTNIEKAQLDLSVFDLSAFYARHSFRPGDILILTVGLGIRAWLSRLNLLMVPRISAVVVVVILLMQLISVGANLLHIPELVNATCFPIIIIAWTIERASMTWEEDGARNTLKQLGASLGAAVVCYLVLANSYLQYLLYTFAELNVIRLGVILLLGTYTGYRLTELTRFEPLVKS